MRAVAVCVGLFVLAFGLRTAAGAESPYTVAIHLQTDRPVYVVGQTVGVRFIIATETPAYYEPWYKPNLEIFDGKGKLVLANSGDFDSMINSTRPMARFPPGRTTLQTCRWRPAGVCRQWWDLASLGYRLHRPGRYTLVADGNIGDYSGVKASPPVTIEILTTAMARARPPVALAETRTNAMFASLASEYVRLRSDLVEMIALTRKGETWTDLGQKYWGWSQQREDLQNRIDGLSSSGNADSPYVQVTANLENAVAGLGAAGDRTISCDARNATVDLGVADYFFNAVRNELSAGRANIADGAHPPQYASPSGYCKATPTPRRTCPVPNVEAGYLGGPLPDMPRGVQINEPVIVLVTVASSGGVVGASVWKTSGNARVDQAVLDAAKRGRYSPKLVDCQPVGGSYLFRPDSAPYGSTSGPAVGGFVMSLTAVWPTAHLLGPIPVMVEVKNISGKPHTGWIGSRSEYQFRVVQIANGAVVRPKPHSTLNPKTDVSQSLGIAPNEFVFGVFELDEIYAFAVPGTYSVEVVRSGAKIDDAILPLKSNTIKITVLP